MPTGLSAGTSACGSGTGPVQLNDSCGALACAVSPTAAAGIGPSGLVIALVVSAEGTGVSTSSAPELAAHPDRIRAARKIADTADGRMRTCTQNKRSTVIGTAFMKS